VEYATRLTLLGESPDDPAVRTARSSTLADRRVVELLEGLAKWPGTVIASHKSAGQPFHRLTFVADLGLTVTDQGVGEIVEAILNHRSEEGPFTLPVVTAAGHEGTGGETSGWALCDAPLTVYALAKMGLADHPAVRAAAAHLTGLVRDNGWPCVVSKELGGFRGPGRKDDPCPFATLAMVKALGQLGDLRDGPACRAGAECLLQLWNESTTRHPYMFFMGTDFRKLKAPFVWYDLLHVLDVLSQFEWLAGDPRLLDMRQVLMSKADDQGRFGAESVWMPWKQWEFGQKQEPSRWITFLAWRILDRWGRS
jgi:hypothetical protein